MKALKTTIRILTFITALLAAACAPEEFDANNPNVDQFVVLLKNNEYKEKAGYDLPDFTMQHVGEMINYLHDTSVLVMFPANPISSKFTAPKLLNECLLWTIEGIRMGNKYPSLEPCLLNTSSLDPSTGYARLSGKELLEVSHMYIQWYNEYKLSPSASLRTKDLLKGTTYTWN